MKQLIAYLLDHAIIDFSGDLTLEMVRDFCVRTIAPKDGSCSASWSKTGASTTWSSPWPTAFRTTSAPESPTTSSANRSASIARVKTSNAPAAVAPFLAALLAAAGCSYPTEVTPYPGLCPKMYVAEWSPSGGAVDVPVDATIKVTFSDYPDPDTVGEPSML